MYRLTKYAFVSNLLDNAKRVLLTHFPVPYIAIVLSDNGAFVLHNIINEDILYIPAAKPDFDKLILAFVKKHKHAKVSILVDTQTQNYVFEKVYARNPIDRIKIAGNHITRLFDAGVPAGWIDTDKQSILIASLPSSDPAIELLKLLKPFSPGIYLLPLEGVKLMAALFSKIKSSPTPDFFIMISEQKHGSVRLIATHKGNFLSTRLSKSHNDIEKELRSSLTQLNKFGLKSSQDLTLLLLSTQNNIDLSFTNKLHLNAVHTVSPHMAAKMLKLPFSIPDDSRFSDTLFGFFFLSSGVHALPLKTPEICHDCLQRNKRFVLSCLSLLAIVFSIAIIAAKLSPVAASVYSSHAANASLKYDTDIILNNRLDDLSLDRKHLYTQKAIDRKAIFEIPVSSPFPVINNIHSALDNIKVTSFTWETSQSFHFPTKFKETLTLLADNADAGSLKKFAASLSDSLKGFSLKTNTLSPIIFEKVE
ncbi:MAG: hypothetical protein FWF23_03565 [Alphaproteobacteria bacterium]|nr:hypothetical protein [Alphaproteobacteria bacterium]MCL2505718.1 hypothetical protein [Alphaproteobacteria bacterium]